MHPYRIIEAGLKGHITQDERYKLEEMQVYSGDDYIEPGYSTDKDFIVVGNFNPTDFDKPGDFGRVCNMLERIAELEWCDEWDTCSECGKLLRTKPDSYCWTRSYHYYDYGSLECMDCIDPEEYLEDINNNPRKAITLDIDPTEYGYEKYNGTFENGWHPGQTDDPVKILEHVQDKGYKDCVFKIEGVGQFDIHFTAYVRR